MQNWFHIFPKNTGLSLYVWIIFCVLPFYFVIMSATALEITIGSLMIVLFFTTYRLSFIKKGWTVYVSVAVEIAINIGMTLYFGYIYFALFISFLSGMYIVELVLLHYIQSMLQQQLQQRQQGSLFKMKHL
ncbi:hypothetical protein [Bacillus sp. JCM 19041]|uniref:hypothetical protein n=1 Tax=Bacillus sp. JCM 19041 TaxID=1460637 RepID=UPI000A99E42C